MNNLYLEHSPVKINTANGPLMVAVYMITYNHEKYIAQAIESVMMQQTNFKYKLFIGEDLSTDNTRNICIEYAKKYPDKISLRLNDVNFLIKNSKATYEGCFNSGAKYMAMLEGDDYWTDPLKLQKQVDFLEGHNDFSFCGHTTEIWNEAEQKITGKYDWKKDIIELHDAVLTPPIHTSSKLFRNGYGLPKNFFKLKAGDDALICYLSERGKGFFFHEPMSVYRLSNVGTWSTLSIKEKEFRVLSIQTWIIRKYPVNLVQQSALITSLFTSIKEHKKLFSKNYNNTERFTILMALLYYKFHTLTIKARQKAGSVLKKAGIKK